MKNTWKGIILVLVAVVAVVIVGFIMVNSYAGTAIAYEEKITEAMANVSAQERLRADTLPNLVDAIKAYDQHEYNTLVSIIQMRQGEDGTYTDDTVKEIKTIISAVAEAYPELKSSENYKQYMQSLMTIEDKLYQLRETYNKSVSRYNTFTRHPIHKFILSLTGYETIEYDKLTFDVSSEAPKNLFGGS